MRKVFTVIGFISAIFFIFSFGTIFGYYLGATPTTEEQLIAQQQTYAGQQYLSDINEIVSNYNTIYNLCEQKYQLVGSGDLDTAFQVKGQIETIQARIYGILDKYNTPAYQPL